MPAFRDNLCHHFRAKDVFVVAMTFGMKGMSTRQSSCPFLVAKNTVFKALLAAFMVLFTAFFHLPALFLTLVFLVVWVLTSVASQGATMTTFKPDVARQITNRLVRVFAAMKGYSMPTQR